MSTQIINILQVILSLVLIGLVLLQSKGTGLGSTFGGQLSFYRSRRGVEKILFIATIVVSVLFMASSVAAVLL